MSPSHRSDVLAPDRALARLLGVLLLLIGSVMATVALAVPESSATAVAPGAASPTPQASLSVQAAAVTWSNSNVTTVSAGTGTDTHTCAIENGNLFCWGWGGSGRLGDDTLGDEFGLRLQPVAVAAGVDGFTQGQVTAVSAGPFYTCAVSAGAAYCWGFGYYLGRGVNTDALVPVPVALNGASVRAIAASSAHACAVTTAGAAWCWGSNADGQLGDGTKTSNGSFVANVLTPVSVSGLTSGVVDVGVGNSHSCALMNTGGVKCWGSGANGRLGRGSSDESLIPVDVAIAGAPITNATQLSVGGDHSCVVTTEAKVRCWGANSAGQLGRGDSNDGWVPNPAVVTSVGGPDLADQVAVSAGQQHTCSVSSAGVVNCWGWNNLGQLGNGLKEASAFKVPQSVPGTASYTNTLVTGVSAAREHTCVVRSGKSVCWGHQQNGRLGNGVNSWSTVAGAVSVFAPPASISPATQTVNGVQGVAITPTTAFSTSNFAGAVTFTGTLPADLGIDSDTGVVSGTPSAVVNTTVTITATDGTDTATASITFTIAAPPPAVDLSALNGVGNTSRNGTVGTPLDPPLVIRTISMAGPVTFAAMTQPSQGVFQATTLPPGLSIVTTSATAAEIVGTPTQDGQFSFYIAAYDNGAAAVHSSSSIAITVAAAASNAADVAPPPPTSATTPSTTVPAPSTTVPAPVSPEAAPATTVPAPGGVGDSALITPELQQQLTSSAGDAKVVVGGELVDVSVTQASADLRASDPAQRTAAQVAELQTLASSMLEQLSNALGGGTGAVSVRNTPTGAVILGLATDPVTGLPMEIPVENVVFVSGGGLILMASGVDGRAPARIGLDGAVEIPEGGYVSIVAGGLTPGNNGEVVVMSTPRLIGSFAVGGSGDIREQAALPAGLGTGAHTLVVTVGDEAASLGFRIVGSSIDMTLPTTGQRHDIAVLWSLVVLAAGAVVLVADRRRRVIA